MGHKRIVRAALLAAITTGMLWTAAGAGAATSDESQFASKINAERRSRGRGALVVKDDLSAVARSWATKMAQAGKISHNPNLAKQVKGNWTILGENVGMGGSVESLHRAFMDSPGHRANILESRYNQLGIGIAMRGNMIFVTEVFAKRTSTGTTRSTTTTTTKKRPATHRSAAPAPAERKPATRTASPEPEPKPEPKPEPQTQAARTVDVLVELVGIDDGNGSDN